MVKPTIIERRSYIRAKRVLSIQFRLVKSNRRNADKQWHISTTYDMSVGGIAFFTDQDYKVNDTLEVEVVLSGVLEIYKCLAKVLRVEKKKGAAHSLVAVKLLYKDVSSRRGKSRVKPSASRNISSNQALN